MSDEIRTNRWVSGDVTVYYWVDRDGELRLTDKSAVKFGCEIKATYQNIDAIPQDVINQIISHNKLADNIKGIVQLTAYREAHRYKITDKVRTGKSSSIIQKPLDVTTSIKNSDLSILFAPNVYKNTPLAVVKLYDGSQYWEDKMVPKPYYNPASGAFAYYYKWIGIQDQFYAPHYRLNEDGVRVLGKFIRETIEVIEGAFPGYAPGKYNNSPDNHLDNRYHYTYVGKGTYEQLMAGIYEDRFDVVMESGGNNTYNKQLGSDFLKEVNVGVKVSTDMVSVLTSTTTNRDYIYTLPPDAKMGVVNGVGGLYDAYGQIYDRDWTASGQTLDGVWITYEMKDRLNYKGIVQEFSSGADETLHLSFKDVHWGIFCGFNTSDKEQFCLSRTKGDHSVNADIIIPKNSNPTIEVILVPAKWKYFVWVLGAYSDAEAPYGMRAKWNAHDFFGTAPTIYGKAGGMFSSLDPGGISWGNNGLMIFSAWSGANGQPIDYRKYGYLATPNGRVHGPIYSDSYIEDVVFGGLTYTAKARRDSLGQMPLTDVFSQFTHWAPGYSAWAQPPSAGQLVAIIRVMYDTGAVDYRYVYAIKTSTDEPILRAYANCPQPYGSVAYFGTIITQPGTYLAEDNFAGHFGRYMEWANANPPEVPTEIGYDYSPTQIAAWREWLLAYNNPPVTESVIDPYYQALYKKISAEYLKDMTSNDQYITNTGPATYIP